MTDSEIRVVFAYNTSGIKPFTKSRALVIRRNDLFPALGCLFYFVNSYIHSRTTIIDRMTQDSRLRRSVNGDGERTSLPAYSSFISLSAT